MQTFKDLTKPWTELYRPQPRRANSRKPSPYSSPLLSSSQQLPPSSSPPPTSPIERQVHSALTTLLLDDSPRKAERQPHNHVCLPEYDGARRAKDLDLLELERARQSFAEEGAETEAADPQGEPSVEVRVPLESQPVEPNSVEPQTENTDVVTESTAENETHASKKRKRESKKEKRRAALLADTRDPYSLEEGYDPTLLAVVGVLDEIKTQENVAAWIHSGGLWGPAELNLREQALKSISEAPEAKANEDRAISDPVIPDAEVSEGSDLSVNAEGGRKEKKRHRKKGSQDIVEPESSSKSSAHVGEGTGANQELTDETATATDTPPPMWFEHPSTRSYWAHRGKDVLEKMGIALEHGIER